MFTHSDTHTVRKKKKKSTGDINFIELMLWSTLLPVRMRWTVSSSRVIRQSFSTVCRVISKLRASDSFRCEYLPDWPFKRYTHPTLYSFWGERRNKWFNTHTHTHLQDSLQMTSQCNGSFFLLRQMYIYKKNASICAVFICPPVFKSKSQNSRSTCSFHEKNKKQKNCKQEHKSVNLSPSTSNTSDPLLFGLLEKEMVAISTAMFNSHLPSLVFNPAWTFHNVPPSLYLKIKSVTPSRGNVKNQNIFSHRSEFSLHPPSFPAAWSHKTKQYEDHPDRLILSLIALSFKCPPCSFLCAYIYRCV